MQDRQTCPLCIKHGVLSYLASFQINLQEAVLLCENNKCLYPVGVASCSNEGVYRRSFTSVGGVASGPRSDSPCRVPSAQISLQAQYTAQAGSQQEQNAGFGTQTDSPFFNGTNLSTSTRSSDIKLKNRLNGYKTLDRFSVNGLSQANRHLNGSRVSDQANVTSSLINSLSDNYDDTDSDLNALFDLVSTADHPTQDAPNATTENVCDIPREKASIKNTFVNGYDLLSRENTNNYLQRNGLLPHSTRTQENARDVLQNSLQHLTNCTSHLGTESKEQKQEETVPSTENRCKLLADDRNADTGETSAETSDTSVIMGDTKLDTAEIDDSTVNIGDTTAEMCDTDAKIDNSTVNIGDTTAEMGDTNAKIDKSTVKTGGNTVVTAGPTAPKEQLCQLFPQWLNKEALCWLDVVLCLLVHNQTVRKLLLGEKTDKTCVLYKLLKAHDQARSILNKLQRRSSLEDQPDKHEDDCTANKSDDLEEKSKTKLKSNVEVLDEKNAIGGGFTDSSVSASKFQECSTTNTSTDVNKCNYPIGLDKSNDATAFKSTSVDTRRNVDETKMIGVDGTELNQRHDNKNISNTDTRRNCCATRTDIVQESDDNALSLHSQGIDMATSSSPDQVLNNIKTSLPSQDLNSDTDLLQGQDLDPAIFSSSRLGSDPVSDSTASQSLDPATDSGSITDSSPARGLDPATDSCSGRGLDPVAADMVKIHGLLEGAREEVWTRLRPRLRCERGQKDSPVFATPLLLQQNAHLERLFCMAYRCKRGQKDSPVFATPLLLQHSPLLERLFCMAYSFVFYCALCGQEEVNEYSNVMPTFPRLGDDFTMTQPRHQRACFRCSNKHGTRTMKYKKLPKCLLMHFVEGVPCSDWSTLQFGHHGNTYTVTGVVQYVNQPDHFVAWLRNPKSNQWAKCDDLGTLVCQFEDTPPDIPPSQVHIVMWERQSAPRQLPNPLILNPTVPNPLVLSKLSVINNVMAADAANCKPTSAQTTCQVCGQFGAASRNNNRCERCCRLHPGAASFHGNSIINPVSYPDNCDPPLCSLTGKPVLNVSKNFPVAVSQEGLLESLVSTATVQQECGAGSSRSSTPCSSLSSLSEISAESVTLPKFTVNTQRGTSLVRPVPCKMDVLALKSSGTSRGDSGAGSDKSGNSVSVESHSATRPVWSTGVLRLLQAQKARSGSDGGIKTATTAARFEGLGLAGRGTSATSFSAFTAAPKSSDKSHDSTSLVDSIAPNGPNSKWGKAMPKSGKATPKSGKVSPKSGKGSLIRQKPKASPAKSDSTNSLTSSNSNFKLPSYVRKQSSSGNLSKTAFKTLNLSSNSNSIENSPLSSRSTSPINSPAFVGNTSYLSTVKQYLINKTSGVTEQKSKFEGLNLRTAPELKRSTNLSGLQLSSATPGSTPSPVASETGSNDTRRPAASYCGRNSTPSQAMSDTTSTSTPSPNTDLSAIISSLLQGNKAVKRRSGDSIAAGQSKLVRRGSRDESSGKPISGSQKSRTGFLGSRDTVNTGKSDCDKKPVRTVIVRRRGGKNMNLIKELNEKNEIRFTPISNSAVPSQNTNPSPRKVNGVFQLQNKTTPSSSPRKVNGVLSLTQQKIHPNSAPSPRKVNSILPLTPQKIDRNGAPRCDTDTVLQDLYEALNIPFTAVPDTMSDIMMDVNDILGMVDSAKLAPSPTLLAPGPGSQMETGNQAGLDCSVILTFRHYA